MRDVLLRPVITEKSMALAKEKRYTFIVEPSATKRAIARAVRALFGVTAVRISTSRRAGKTRRVGRKRITVVLPSVKKAIVEITKDQSIPLFDIGEEKQ